jgi:hypothetical protein
MPRGVYDRSKSKARKGAKKTGAKKSAKKSVLTPTSVLNAIANLTENFPASKLPQNINQAAAALDDGEFEDSAQIDADLSALDDGLEEYIKDLTENLQAIKAARAFLNKNLGHVKNRLSDALVECPHCNHSFNKNLL